jgi:hypothetical protein
MVAYATHKYELAIASVIGCAGGTLNEAFIAANDLIHAADDNMRETVQFFLEAEAGISDQSQDVSHNSAKISMTLIYDFEWKYFEQQRDNFKWGVCLDTKPNPAYTTMLPCEMRTSDFLQLQVNKRFRKTIEATGLQANTTYYYRPVIIFNGTPSYGEEKTFTTNGISIILESPTQGSRQKSGTPVTVTFQTRYADIDEPAPNILLSFKSSGGTSAVSAASTDNNGNISIVWTPNQKGAMLTAQLLSEDGNVLGESTFAPTVWDDDDIFKYDIAGTWSGAVPLDVYREYFTSRTITCILGKDNTFRIIDTHDGGGCGPYGYRAVEIHEGIYEFTDYRIIVNIADYIPPEKLAVGSLFRNGLWRSFTTYHTCPEAETNVLVNEQQITYGGMMTIYKVGAIILRLASVPSFLPEHGI